MYSYNILNLFNHRILQNLKKFVVGLEKRIKRGGVKKEKALKIGQLNFVFRMKAKHRQLALWPNG